MTKIMTQNEFEQRIGKEVTLNEYAAADAVYMICNMEKDEFCAQYQKADSKLLHEVTGRYYSKERMAKKFQDQSEQLAVALMEEAEIHDDSQIRDRVRSILGKESYVRLCLERGYRLDPEDRNYILNNLRF